MLARTVPAPGRAASPRRPPPSLRSGVLALTDAVYPGRGGSDTAEGPAIAAADDRRGGGCLGPVRFAGDRRQGGAGRVRRRPADLGRGRPDAGRGRTPAR